jgi:MFS family permease
MTRPVELGLRANARQFALLVGLNALVGGMVGLERSVLPLLGKQDFGLRSSATILTFVLAFGAAKAVTNLAAGDLAERFGRKRLLVLGWMCALPVPLLIGLAPSWWFIVGANLLLGVNQGFAWSMTVVMKIDLAGARRRGLALGLNEAAGYLGVAAAAFASGVLAASYAPRTVVWMGAALIATVGLMVSALAVRDTHAHVAHEQEALGNTSERRLGLGSAFARASMRDPVLRACSQAGLVNNLNDALAWGLAPLYLAAHGATLRQIAVVAAVYPVVWGAGQLATGWLSDVTGRKPLIVGGMLTQAAALALLVAGGGRFAPSFAAAVGLGIGTAMVYPTLIAAVSDAVEPRDRARVIGVYRFWRDFGFVLGALAAGFGADAVGSGATIAAVAALTAGSGVFVAATRWRRRTIDERLRWAQARIKRLEPQAALAAVANGALLVDLRSHDERARSGVIPGSLHIPRSVLEWRLDPESAHHNPMAADLDRELILLCSDGYSSSLAAVSVQELGYARVADVSGGFRAWQEAGLSVRRPTAVPGLDPPGMGPPEPAERVTADAKGVA